MVILKKIWGAIIEPRKMMFHLNVRGFLNWMSDSAHVRLMYRLKLDKKLNLDNPQTFSEKLQWLKLHDRNPMYTKMVDKYEVREYIKEKLGEEYLIPLLGAYDSFDEIDFDELPTQFVLKCTHDSGGLVICKDKSKLDLKQAKKKIKKSFKRKYYYHSREWPYKNVKPRIICEKYMVDESGMELKDYRLFCFNGVPRFVAVDFSITDKTKTRRNLYDMDWGLMEEGITYPRVLVKNVQKPAKFDEMVKLSKILSKDIPHVRIDFYEINGKVYFGEMTFYHQSGFGRIYPEEFDYKMGSWIELPSR